MNNPRSTPEDDAKERMVELARTLPRPDAIVFDMDGTLYFLDGVGRGFAGSTLERAVDANAIAYVMERERGTPDAARAVYDEAKSDPVGASSFFSRRYGNTRADYFNATWGKVDCSSIVPRNAASKTLIENMRGTTDEFFLVTAAPRTWMSKVMERLEIDAERLFRQTFTAEDFLHKREVFERLASENRGKRIFSVGDTWDSDIGPAVEAGMVGFHVTEVNPLENLLLAGTLRDA